MPFLRRRGALASESDMRRQTAFFHPQSASKLPPQQPQQPTLSTQPTQPTQQHQHQQEKQPMPLPCAPSASQQSPPVLPSLSPTDIDSADLMSAANTSSSPTLAALPSAAPAHTTAAAAATPSTPPTHHGRDLSGSSDHSNDATSRGMVSLDSTARPPSRPANQSPADSSVSQAEAGKFRRFSLLRFRNASDPQLSLRARQQAQAHVQAQALAEPVPPLPRPPEIITTAPTMDFNPPTKHSRSRLPGRARQSADVPRAMHENFAAAPPAPPAPPVPSNSSGNAFRSWPKRDRRKSMAATSAAASSKPHAASAFVDSTGKQLQRHDDETHMPPAYGDDAGTALALPVNRLSESSRSDASSGDRVYGTTTTTTHTHTVHTTTTFFRLPRRGKQTSPAPLFPIAHLQQKGQQQPPPIPTVDGAAPSLAPSPLPANDGQQTPTPSRPPSQAASAAAAGTSRPASRNPTVLSLSSGSPAATAPSPARALFQLGNPSPASAFFRPSSRNSGHSSPTRSSAAGGLGAGGVSGVAHSHLRGRSSTISSLGQDSIDERLTPPALRTSASAVGRKSFGDLLGLSRLRQNSDTQPSRQGTLTPATPNSGNSKNNSLQLLRDTIILPERRDDDTPAKYLARLEEVVSRSVIASALSKATDPFSHAVLRSYMRSFKFFGEPMDMAIRKLLMEAELPRETQQIDRCLQAFANRYDECNPGIYSSPDQAYFIAFSLLILHTDVFNKNNKHKMQKQDYLKNTRGDGIFDEILDVFYDNITYTPFIHVEDDYDINGERIVAHKAKRKSIFPGASPDLTKKSSKEPIDPYTLIFEDRLEVLRPNLKEVMQLDDPYSYVGTAKSLNMKELQTTFFRTGVLQIVSARSRPDAFMTEKTATNPEDAHPGIVDIKITKVGLLWRKDAKKKKTRSPWQEWGAILTGAQLYFFRNTAWVKSLIHQYETHVRHGNDGIPIIFKPPLEEFKPDALMSTDGAVALLDSSYKKHKHAFTYVRHGGYEEVLLADNEDEMNDWLAKLNYAAAFRTSGVRMRGVVGGLYEGQNRRALRQLGSDESQSVQTPTGEVTITRSRIDQKMAHDILAARRDIMLQKVADANEKIEAEDKKLEVQLRNSRHLQILAPIQPKTREQLLLSAARMATQVKWTRVELWRLKCHRDILEMDLDEERQQMGLGPEHALAGGAVFTGMVRAASAASAAAAAVARDSSLGDQSKKLDQQQQQQQQQLQEPHEQQPQQQAQLASVQSVAGLSRELSKASTATASTVLQRSPYSVTHSGSADSGVGTVGTVGTIGSSSALPVVESFSPLSDVFQTPPATSTAAAASQQDRRRTSSDVTSALFDNASLRKASVSSLVSSSGLSVALTPPRVVRSSVSATQAMLDKPHPPLPPPTFQLPTSGTSVAPAITTTTSTTSTTRTTTTTTAATAATATAAAVGTGANTSIAAGSGAAASSTAHSAAAAAEETAQHERDSNDVDKGERDLIQQAGLTEYVPPNRVISSGTVKSKDKGKGKSTAVDDGSVGGQGTGGAAGDDKRVHQQQQQLPEPQQGQATQNDGKLDRSKIRRSLQRTFRESAGHLSHHRSRKAKDSTAAGGAAEETGREPGVLERGTGSFVVHGKKASVITFGGDLQQSAMSPDERLRQRKTKRHHHEGQGQGQGHSLSQQPSHRLHKEHRHEHQPLHQDQQPAAASVVSLGLSADQGAAFAEAGAVGGDDGGNNDAAGGESRKRRNSTGGGPTEFQAAVLKHQRDHERRESAASASTATAQSFRELRRKYSAVRVASRSSAGGKVRVLSDDDDGSEAAVSIVSVSEGRHTPLFGATQMQALESDDGDEDEDEDEDEGEDEDEDEEEVDGVGVEDGDGNVMREENDSSLEPKSASALPALQLSTDGDEQHQAETAEAAEGAEAETKIEAEPAAEA